MIRRGGKVLIPFAADAVEGNSIKEISCERERERVTYLGDIRRHYALGRKHAMLAASRSNNKYKLFDISN